MQLGFFDGPDWPSDSSSDFEGDLLPDSPGPSPDDESVDSSDVALYEPRCVC